MSQEHKIWEINDALNIDGAPLSVARDVHVAEKIWDYLALQGCNKDHFQQVWRDVVESLQSGMFVPCMISYPRFDLQSHIDTKRGTVSITNQYPYHFRLDILLGQNRVVWNHARANHHVEVTMKMTTGEITRLVRRDEHRITSLDVLFRRVFIRRRLRSLTTASSSSVTSLGSLSLVDRC